MSIFPYAYRMVESFQITQDESRISIYAGMLITAFAFAEFSTGVVWGRISDRFGRKPVLLMGLFGTAISMICLGFSRSMLAAVTARALGGLLNGNVGVLQTTVAELVTKKEHQPRAYSIMPFVWCLGSIIGPAMGGALAMPCDSYPWLFSKGGIFDTFPFLLPNLVCVGVLALGILNGFLFLEETHADLKHRRDRGRAIGSTLTNIFRRPSTVTYSDKVCASNTEIFGLSHDDPPPGYRSTENSPRLSSSPPPIVIRDTEASSRKEDRGVCKTFNRQVVLVILGYGILAYHSVAFDALVPIFLSEQPSQQQPQLPFKFSGGFGLSTKTIGFMMAVQGVYSMFAQLWLFPFVVRRLGTLHGLRLVMLLWPLLYFAMPYLVLLPKQLQSAGIYFALLLKITFHVIAFPSNAILLANAAHSKAVLGTINGVAASTACLSRAFGPTVSGSIHSAGLNLGYNGFAWWTSGLVCILGAIEAYFIKDTDADTDPPCESPEEQTICEPLLTTTVDETELAHDEVFHINELHLDKDVKVEYL